MILLNGIEYMIYWLLEYFEFIGIWHRFVNEIVTCQTSGYIYVEVGSVFLFINVDDRGFEYYIE